MQPNSIDELIEEFKKSDDANNSISRSMKQLYDTIKWSHEWKWTSKEDIDKEFYIKMIQALDRCED